MKQFLIVVMLSATITTSCYADVADSNNFKLVLVTRDRPTFLQGEPFTMQLGIKDLRLFGKSNDPEIKQKLEKGDMKAETFGAKDWPWFKGLTIQLQKTEKLDNGQNITIPVLEKIDWIEKVSSPRNGASINNQPVYGTINCVFTIDPETFQTLKPGFYTLKVKWDSTKQGAQKSSIWQGKLETKAEIAVVEAKTDEDKGKLAFAKASYYSNLKDYDEALSEALLAEKLFPSYNQSLCYAIIGNIYEKKGDIVSALKYYKIFYEENKKAENEWDYVITVKHKMEYFEESLKNENRMDPEKVSAPLFYIDLLISKNPEERFKGVESIKQQYNQLVDELIKLAAERFDSVPPFDPNNSEYIKYNAKYLAIVLLGDIEANKAVPVLLDNLEFKNKYYVYSGSYTDPERLYPSAIALTKIGTPVIEPTIKKLSQFNKNEAGHKICCWILKEILGAKLAKASVQIAIDETLNVTEKQNLNDTIPILDTYIEEDEKTYKP